MQYTVDVKFISRESLAPKAYPLIPNLSNPKQKNATSRWHYTRDYFYLLEMLFKVQGGALYTQPQTHNYFQLFILWPLTA